MAASDYLTAAEKQTAEYKKKQAEKERKKKIRAEKLRKANERENERLKKLQKEQEHWAKIRAREYEKATGETAKDYPGAGAETNAEKAEREKWKRIADDNYRKATGKTTAEDDRIAEGIAAGIGWEKNDARRAAANPMKGTHAAWERKKDKQDEVKKSKAYLDYMNHVSNQFGDTEFVGGLIDSLTSNRYYPGEGGNKGMDPVAGSDRGWGPKNIDGLDSQMYSNMKGNGWDFRDALDYSMVDPNYRGFISAEDINNASSGGEYLGPTSNSDDAWGLVKLGLYGNGRGDFADVTGDIRRNYVGRGADPENMENQLAWSRGGYKDSIDWIKDYLPEGSDMENAFGWYPGGLLQESHDWVGGISTKPGMLKEDNMYGVHYPYYNEIEIDPNVRGIDQTTNHELMHRGLTALESEYRYRGQDPNAFNSVGSKRTNRINLGKDPDTGSRVSMHDFLINRELGQDDEVSSGDKGHSFEHNMINAAGRNRAQRGHFLSFDDPSSFGSIKKQNKQREDNAEGLNKLGLLGHAIVDSNQRKKSKWLDETRNRNDSPRIFGGKSGTAVHPLMKAAGY